MTRVGRPGSSRASYAHVETKRRGGAKLVSVPSEAAGFAKPGRLATRVSALGGSHQWSGTHWAVAETVTCPDLTPNTHRPFRFEIIATSPLPRQRPDSDVSAHMCVSTEARLMGGLPCAIHPPIGS